MNKDLTKMYKKLNTKASKIEIIMGIIACYGLASIVGMLLKIQMIYFVLSITTLAVFAHYFEKWYERELKMRFNQK